VSRRDPFARDGRGLPVVSRAPWAVGSVHVIPLVDMTRDRAPDMAHEPHRHDFHELLWTRSGRGEHSLDGHDVVAGAATLLLITRGQVHRYIRSFSVYGASVRFGDELLLGADPGPAGASAPSAGWIVRVPDAEFDRVDATMTLLERESTGFSDDRAPAIQRHLLQMLLASAERWRAAQRADAEPGAGESAGAAVALHRRFSELLERDFTREHAIGHYARELAVSPSTLSRTLKHVAGRAAKELVTDRVMLEAARLLRFTDHTVGEVADAVGFTDQLYFSRAFKLHQGETPTAFRRRVRR
jgi:AraC family transcriptional activator of pobA